MNVKDIAFLKCENIKNGTLSFIQEKTKHSTKDNIQKIEVFITEDLDRIINKCGKKPKGQHLLCLILEPKGFSDVQT